MDISTLLKKRRETTDEELELIEMRYQQALALMNSEFLATQAEQFARRVLHDVGPSKMTSDAGALDYAFRLAVARKPEVAELEMLLRFVQEQTEHYAGLPAAERQLRVYSDLCQSLFSANEVVYID